MNIRIDPLVVASYPTYGAGVLIAKNVQLNDQHAELISTVIAEALATMSQTEYQALAETECRGWREVYKRMELKASRVLCSFESMCERARKSRRPITDQPAGGCLNAISLKHALCLGVYDLEKIKRSIEIRFSAEGENLPPIGSIEALKLGSKAILYADRAGPICAWWNYRDADCTKVEGGSRDVIFFVDDLNFADGRAQRAINNLFDIIEKISESGVQLQKRTIAGSSH